MSADATLARRDLSRWRPAHRRRRGGVADAGESRSPHSADILSRKVVHGDDLLYRFFDSALRDEPELFRRVPQMLLSALAVWIPTDVFAEWPVLLPWVVRDPRCRGSRSRGEPDSWSAPDEQGYLRDDNSLVKSLPRAWGIRGPKGGGLAGSRLGTEFVAAHVWRTVRDTRLASRIPELNTFVPNLVWLPSQVAKLTDREGGTVQRTVQAMAHRIYRDAPVRVHLDPVVDRAWSLIPEPSQAVEPFAMEDLNWFTPTPTSLHTRRARLRTVIEALDTLEAGGTLPERVVTRRYAAGLPAVSSEARTALRDWLRVFLRDDGATERARVARHD